MTENISPRAGKREWIGLAVIALSCMLYSMDLTVLYLAVPSLTADLKPSSSQLLWITDIYGFLVAGSLITMGTLGDRIGRRKLLLIGAVAFGAASMLAAFSTSAEMLIAARAILGFAGATLAPSTLSLIRNMFLDPGQRTQAIGIWTTSYSVGAAIGPMLGGLLLQHFWWGSVFLVCVPVMLLLLILGPKLLPEFKDPNAGKLDLISAAMSLVSVLAIIYGLKRIAEYGIGIEPALFIVAGLIIGLLFVLRQKRLIDPFIDLNLFRAPAFSASLAINMFTLFVTFGTFLFIAQYLQLVLGLSPMNAGLWTVPSSLGFVIGCMAAPMIVRWFSPVSVITAGLILGAIGLSVLAQANAVHGLTYIVVGSIILALGVAPVVTLGTDIVVGLAPPERAGAAAAISETCAEFGGAIGIAVLGSIGTAVYQGFMADNISSAIPHEAAETAENTLGGALAAAAHLPAHLGSVLVNTAREAFTHSLDLVAAISVVVFIITAILAVVMLRRKGIESEA